MDIQNKTFFNIRKERLTEYICPLLLAVSVFFASLYTFHKPSAWLLTAVYIFAATFLFKRFDALRQKKSGAFIYALIFAVVIFISFALVAIHAASFGFLSPLRWFYAQDDNGFQPDLIAALALGGGFFLTSIIYYFTLIRYRTMGIMLCTMFPFFFFAKRSDIMPNILITVIMLLFLAVVIHNKRVSSNGREKDGVKLKTDRAYIICISVFILITGAITMAAEKPYYEAFLEKNSRFFTPFNFGAGASSGFEMLSEQSSPRNMPPAYSYEPLFYFETNSDTSEFYLRTKSFDVFNGEVWTPHDSGSYYYYSMQMPEYSTDDIAADMAALTGKNASDLYTKSFARAFDEDFTPVYLPAPYGIITDDKPAHSLRYYKESQNTSVLRGTSYYYLTSLNDSFEFIEPQRELYELAREKGFDSDGYFAFLETAGENEHANRLKRDYEKAVRDYTDMTEVSQRLAELSKQIVAECNSDIEKAEKLESYFAKNGFKYSLEYVPEDNSVDYFVFESKTGYCAGYATAMTLMARSVGLPARYVEGFAAFEKNEEGQFVIRDGYAHAFVEVYIPGAGWLTFDPTVSDYRSVPDSADAAHISGLIARVFNAFNRISVIIVIAFIVLFFSVVDRIRELLLRISLHFRPFNARIINLYGNLIKTVGASVGEDFSAYTPDMLRQYLSENRGVAPERLISLFEKTAFGGYECNSAEYALAYKEYKKCYRYLRRPYKKADK